VYHSTLGLIVIKKKKRSTGEGDEEGVARLLGVELQLLDNLCRESVIY